MKLIVASWIKIVTETLEQVYGIVSPEICLKHK